jgi:integration host factor subunit alpha
LTKLGVKANSFRKHRRLCMTLTKTDLINSISNYLSIPKRRSAAIVESLLDIIKDTLESGEDILISRFGKFCVKDKGERRGRNPQTNSEMVLGARRVVTFNCSGVLRKKVNGENE